MNWWQILMTILAVPCILEIVILLIVLFKGGASDFTYYICRPFGIPMPMVYGFLLRLVEVAFVAWTVAMWFSL